jgi:hypothetical protein
VTNENLSGFWELPVCTQAAIFKSQSQFDLFALVISHPDIIILEYLCAS